MCLQNFFKITVGENQNFFAVLNRKQWKLTSACLVVTSEKDIPLRIKYPEQLVQFVLLSVSFKCCHKSK
jgi:hypothetical protein